MAVKCVFYITGVEKRANGIGVLNAQPVAKGPYQDWAQYTPTGTLQLTSLNPAATEWFMERIGKDVTLLIDDATADDLK
jgi:hypothetical protein